MEKKPKLALYAIAVLVIIALSFLAGAVTYRAGVLSDLKSRLLPPPPTLVPSSPTPDVDMDFSMKYLEDPIGVAMNSLPLEDDQEPLKFLVAGHIYGNPGDEEFHPAVTLINNVALLRSHNPDFVAFLGDTVWKPEGENFNALELLILNPFQVPIYNAVGNHDVTKREIYQARYGSTVFGFRYKNQSFIFLDTTLHYYDLNPDQFAFIKNIIEDHIQSKDITGIHIFMHHVLFLNEEEIYGKQHLKPNEGDGVSEAFQDFLESTLYPASKSIPIYVYAGDVGAFKPGNLSPLYKKPLDYNITFLATGLGNHQNDSILIVEADSNQDISITPFSLTGKKLKEIEAYDLEYWLAK